MVGLSAWKPLGAFVVNEARVVDVWIRVSEDSRGVVSTGTTGAPPDGDAAGLIAGATVEAVLSAGSATTA